jgi:Ca2+-binding RTX toxin-like protein
LEKRSLLSATLGGAGSVTFTENDAATAVAASLTVTDAGSPTQASATISITNYVSGEDALAFTNDGSTMGNIAVASNASGVLTLSSAGGAATNAEWQAALRAVTYVNTSDAPSVTARNVTFVVNDGVSNSNTVAATVNISATNDAPVLTVSGNVAFNENGAAIAIDSGLTVTDLDNTTLTSATVTITNFVAGQDSLAFTNDGSTMGNIAVSSNASGVLTLSSAGGIATTTQWQAALRAVTYVNTSDNPIVTARNITFSVNDGANVSNSLSSTITINASNDAPVLSGLEISALGYAPNAAATNITATLQIADADSTTLTGATIQIAGNYHLGEDSLAFANTANITGIFNPVTGTLTLTGTDTVANYQAAIRSVTYVSTSQDPSQRIVSVQVSDLAGASNVATRAIGGALQLIGTTLNVYGTTDLDVITVASSDSLTINRDGEIFTYAPGQVTAINIYGGDGNDSIRVDSLAAGTSIQLSGGNGNDSLRLDSSITADAMLTGGDGNDLLVGGAGVDTLVGGLGDDYLIGSANADILAGGDGFNYLVGGTGDDTYSFDAATTNQIDTVVELTGEGTDLLDFTTLTTAVTVDLSGSSHLATMDHRIVMVGASGQAANFENVNGGSANDFMTGNAAANILVGNNGNDTLQGGDGDDQLIGGIGQDLLIGGNQNDTLEGGVGDDYLIGDAGADVLIGGEGYNYLVGGVGDDTYQFTATTVNHIETVVELAGEGTDALDFSTLTASVNANLTSDTSLAVTDHRILVTGASGQAANFETVIGGSGNDQITGNASSNLLIGNNGNDTINGQAGDDILVGGLGNDTLQGVSGANILIGGGGGDLLQGGTGTDILMAGSTDFDSNSIALSAMLSEWVQVSPLATRVDHLLGNVVGGLNGNVVLGAATSTTDSDADYLTGNAGADWYLANSAAVQDVISDQVAGEVVTNIDAWV